MNEEKTSSNILKDFQKQGGQNKIDKISLSKGRIGFLSGFIIFNKLTQLNYVEIFYNIEDRRIAFTFTNVNKEPENHKLTKRKGEDYRCRKLSNRIVNELNISSSDYKRYSYTKYFEDGKEIYVIQLSMKSN